jgi:hypothetical protein
MSSSSLLNSEFTFCLVVLLVTRINIITHFSITARVNFFHFIKGARQQLGNLLSALILQKFENLKKQHE